MRCLPYTTSAGVAYSRSTQTNQKHMRTRAHHRCGTWLALTAITLYALWPLLATAQPRGQGGHYELCPHVWMHKFAEETGREAPAPGTLWGDHQLKCAFSPGTGDGSSPLPDATAILLIDGWQIDFAAVSIDAPRFSSRFYATAPRGPPVVS